MSLNSDDEVIVSEGRVSGRSKLYGWLLGHLAKFPGRVTAVTFAAGVVVTVVVVLTGGDSSPTGLVSLVATLWALFFAIMIYLLTARDTDKVLDQIADLREQLSTALAAPGEDEVGEAADDAADVEEPVTTPTDVEPATPAQREPALPEVTPTESHDVDAVGGRGDRRRPAGVDHRRPGRPAAPAFGPRLLNGSAAIVDAVPAELLNAWTSATGKKPDQLARAWNRDPRSDRQWVLETTGQERWLVFSKGDRGVGVMSLDDIEKRYRR
jgi:hypothetical protein